MKRPAIVLLLFVALLGRCWANQADDALEAAQKLACDGKYEEALQKHIWYHKHALEIDYGQYGVRLSFALSYWVDLGKKYPPALKSLKEIRDEDCARLTAGEQNRDLFHDIVAINEEVGESAATVGLFKKLDAAEPTFASSVAELADKSLFDAEEFQLEKKYLGDPFVRFAEVKRTLDFGLEFAKACRTASRSGQAFENNFTQDVVRLIVVLDKTGEHEIAQQIQTKALAACNNATIRGATSQSP
jgi:hypothetical protein